MPRWWASESYSSDFTVRKLAALPSELRTNLYLWMDPESITSAVDAAVSSWPDSSGNGRDFSQVTGSYQPTLRKDASGFRYVEFDGTNDHLKHSGLAFPSGSGQYTVAVSAWVDVTSDQVFYGAGKFNNTNKAFMIRTGSSKYRDSWWSNNLDGGSLSTGVWVSVASRFDGSGRDLWVGSFSGSPTVSDSQTAKDTLDGNDGSLIGCSGSNTGSFGGLQNFLDGRIREILIWDTALSDALVEAAGNYLTDRYA